MKTKPTADEIEVTLLGPGVGESVVVHLGGGRWMLVDSYLEDGRPAAQRYLDSIGVGRDQVDVIVATHVHRDHYQGVGALHAYYEQAALHFPSALGLPTYRQLWGVNVDGEVLGGLPGALRRARARVLDSGRPSRRRLQVDSGVIQVGAATVKALSPSDIAVSDSEEALAPVLASADPLGVLQFLKNQNETSVVLHIDVGHASVLLGADLEVSPRRHGWHAIVNNPDLGQLSRSSVFKVPHHGSVNADADVTWTDLLADSPHLLVAPYWTSQLPREDRDVPRLRERGHCLWQVAPSSKWLQRPDGALMANPGTTGRVTARKTPADQDWRIRHVPPALPPFPAISAGADGSATPSCSIT
jgi:hypothetical protein